MKLTVCPLPRLWDLPEPLIDRWSAPSGGMWQPALLGTCNAHSQVSALGASQPVSHWMQGLASILNVGGRDTLWQTCTILKERCMAAWMELLAVLLNTTTLCISVLFHEGLTRACVFQDLLQRWLNGALNLCVCVSDITMHSWSADMAKVTKVLSPTSATGLWEVCWNW